MNDRIDEEKAIEAEAEEIKKHLSTLTDQKEIVDAREAIALAILGAGERERAHFLKGKTREAIVRASIDLTRALRPSES